jgi:hypothetical protein
VFLLRRVCINYARFRYTRTTDGHPQQSRREEATQAPRERERERERDEVEPRSREQSVKEGSRLIPHIRRHAVVHIHAPERTSSRVGMPFCASRNVHRFGPRESGRHCSRTSTAMGISFTLGPHHMVVWMILRGEGWTRCAAAERSLSAKSLRSFQPAFRLKFSRRESLEG